jgi:hypothetical protein
VAFGYHKEFSRRHLWKPLNHLPPTMRFLSKRFQVNTQSIVYHFCSFPKDFGASPSSVGRSCCPQNIVCYAAILVYPSALLLSVAFQEPYVRAVAFAHMSPFLNAYTEPSPCVVCRSSRTFLQEVQLRWTLFIYVRPSVIGITAVFSRWNCAADW